MRLFAWLALLVVVFLSIAFAYLNSQNVVLNYSFGQQSLPLSLLLALTLSLGVFVTCLAYFPFFLKQKFFIRQLRKQLKQAEQEVANLRRIPMEK